MLQSAPRIRATTRASRVGSHSGRLVGDRLAMLLGASLVPAPFLPWLIAVGASVTVVSSLGTPLVAAGRAEVHSERQRGYDFQCPRF